MVIIKRLDAVWSLFFLLCLISTTISFGNNKNDVKFWQKKGNKHCRAGQFDLGMEAYAKALELAPDSLPKVHYKILLNIANVYACLESYDRAKKFYDRAKDKYLTFSKGLSPGIFMGYGGIKVGKGQYDEAITFFSKAQESAEKRNDTGNIILSKVNIALAMEGNEKYEEALIQYEDIAKRVHILKDSLVYCFALKGAGDCLIKLEKFDDAEKKLQEAIVICEAIGAKDRLVELKNSMAKLKIAIKEYDKAVHLLEIEKIGRDSLLGIGVLDKVISIEEGINNYRIKFKEDSKNRITLLLIIVLSSLLSVQLFLPGDRLKDLIKSIHPLHLVFATHPIRLPIVYTPQYEPEVDSKSKIIWKALEKLMNEDKLFLNDNLSIHELAQQLRVSKNNLSKAINEHGQVNFKQYLNDLRIAKAVEFLKNKNMVERYTIESIALKCGFKNKVNFYYVFKQKMQITPSEFVKKNDQA